MVDEGGVLRIIMPEKVVKAGVGAERLMDSKKPALNDLVRSGKSVAFAIAVQPCTIIGAEPAFAGMTKLVKKTYYEPINLGTG